MYSLLTMFFGDVILTSGGRLIHEMTRLAFVPSVKIGRFLRRGAFSNIVPESRRRVIVIGHFADFGGGIAVASRLPRLLLLGGGAETMAAPEEIKLLL